MTRHSTGCTLIARTVSSEADGPVTIRVTGPNSLGLQRFSRLEWVTGIEPALSAWEEFLPHRVSLSCNDTGGLS
jgi:hypothetical protein